MSTGSVSPADRLVTLPDGVPDLTLGWEAIRWATKYLRQPNGPRVGQRFEFTDTQARFLLWWYALDNDGNWLYHHGVRRLAKGSGKSPFAAAMALVEFLAPVRLKGWDSDSPGGCVGKPVHMPWVQIAATAESQTTNTMRMVRAFAPKGSRIVEDYQLDPGKQRYYKMPEGTLEVITSSYAAAEGAEATFIVADETEHWVSSNGGPDFASTLSDNLAKSGSRMLETSNAWSPGVDSVAENTWHAWVAQEEGRVRARSKILYDARVAPPDTDLSDDTSLSVALRHVYADCYWADLHAIKQRIWDPRSTPEDSRKKYLNQPTVDTDSWLAPHEWNACSDPEKTVTKKDMVTLGFDGSRKRSRGVTDATALVACRVRDGHLFPVQVWEQPEHEKDWRIPAGEVNEAVKAAFREYNVVGFYCDPAKWESYVADWEATYGEKLKVKASQKHPCEWWMSGGRAVQIVRATEKLHTAVLDKEMTHDGSSVLTRHMMNARRRVTTSGIQIAKETPDSPKKIDAAVASILAFQARVDAIAAGVLEQGNRSRRIYRY